MTLDFLPAAAFLLGMCGSIFPAAFLLLLLAAVAQCGQAARHPPTPAQYQPRHPSR